jgi:site-specific DNA-cytosine methylase
MPVDYANAHRWFAVRGHLIGGFDLGFERAGFEIKFQVEIDPFCRAVLAKHWPDGGCKVCVRCRIQHQQRAGRLLRA